MEYHVQLGQCTISNIEAAIIIEILGTYLPFVIIVWSYWKSQERACARSRYLSDVDATANPFLQKICIRISQIFPNWSEGGGW